MGTTVDTSNVRGNIHFKLCSGSGITLSKMLKGVFYTHRLQKLTYLHLFAEL